MNRWSEKRYINKNIYGCDKCIIIFLSSLLLPLIIQVLRIKNANICERTREIFGKMRRKKGKAKMRAHFFGFYNELIHEMMTKKLCDDACLQLRALIKNRFPVLVRVQFGRFLRPYLDADSFFVCPSIRTDMNFFGSWLRLVLWCSWTCEHFYGNTMLEFTWKLNFFRDDV